MTNAEKALQYFIIAVPEDKEQAEAYFWARKALSNMVLQEPSDTYSEMDYVRELEEKAKTEKSIGTEIHLQLIANLIRRAKIAECERDAAIAAIASISKPASEGRP